MKAKRIMARACLIDARLRVAERSLAYLRERVSRLENASRLSHDQTLFDFLTRASPIADHKPGDD